MQAFSAADIVSPAIKRTKWFLFDRFRWSTFLKICLVSVITEGGTSGRFSVPGRSHAGTSTTATPTIAAPHVSPLELAMIAAAVVLLIGIAFVIAYLITRLRFAFFHCLVQPTREIRPGWRIYEAQSWRFFLLTLAVGFTFLFVTFLIALPFLIAFYRMLQGLHPGSGAVIGLILPLIPVIILIVLLGLAIQIILNDFMLPHFALENTSAGEAWRQVRTRIVAEKGGFLLYAILRILLPIAAMLGAIIILAVPALFTAMFFAAPSAGLAAIISGATGATKLFFIFLIAVIVLVAVAVVILLGLCITGPIGVAVRNYALLFYGGRYKVLGDLLSPPAPPPPIVENAGTA